MKEKRDGHRAEGKDVHVRRDGTTCNSTRREEGGPASEGVYRRRRVALRTLLDWVADGRVTCPTRAAGVVDVQRDGRDAKVHLEQRASKGAAHQQCSMDVRSPFR